VFLSSVQMEQSLPRKYDAALTEAKRRMGREWRLIIKLKRPERERQIAALE
jgi:hypothetical protein